MTHPAGTRFVTHGTLCMCTSSACYHHDNIVVTQYSTKEAGQKVAEVYTSAVSCRRAGECLMHITVMC